MEEQNQRIRKMTPGQSGPDGNGNARSERIYLRASAKEKAELRSLAQESGFHSLAPYIRQRALHGNGPYERSGEHLAWLGTVNRIANYLDDIASQLQAGRQPDEDLLLHVMQISDLADETLKEVCNYNERAIAGVA